ncbi:pentapeptide repeat-containing protein [Paenibacillus ginsengihumi]|uniref:pentapeptide repeat-containing protein n=1 Tax=Paenibacillus ginsengihumi TaxID=431596 RepID=UPI00035CBF29|nr:pentapeptide repeat-containing protein [Paenibacillus ginsengihumi]
MIKISQSELNERLANHQHFINSKGEKGEKIILDEMDFSDRSFFGATCTGVHITSSLFQNCVFENVEFYDCYLCDCRFENVTFENVNIVKANLSYSTFDQCEFHNSKIWRCDTIETEYSNSSFHHCALYDCFAYSSLRNMTFHHIDFEDLSFYCAIVKNIHFANVIHFDEREVGNKLNLGSFDEEKIVTDEEAIRHLRSQSVWL